MSIARRTRREPLTTRLMRRAEMNEHQAHPPQFIRDGELCREAAERLMKLEGFFDAMGTMIADAGDDH